MSRIYKVKETFVDQLNRCIFLIHSMTQPLKGLVSGTVEQSTYVGVSVTLSNMIHMPGKLANTMCFSHLFI